MSMPPWSYSSLTAFETCPKRYYLTRVTKQVVEPQTEATIWGVEVHSALELRIKDGTPLPQHLSHYEGYCAQIVGGGGEVSTERQYALNRQFQEVDWWDKEAWCRGIIDVEILKRAKAAVLDWKTGKVKPASAQLMLFAAFILHTKPEVEEVQTAFIWLKHDKTTKQTFLRGDLPLIWREFAPRVQRLEWAYAEDKWEAKPSGLCRAWCPVGSSACHFCGR